MKLNSKKVFIITIALTLFINVVSAGFASSFLPKIDGELTLEVQPGKEVSYFIYPQNLGDEILYIKINLTDVNETVQNELEEMYEILPNTQSDEFPIELKIKVPRTAKPGTTYPLSYEVLTTTETTESGMVSFNPVGFGKSFIIKVPAPDKEPFPWFAAIILPAILLIMLLTTRFYFVRRKKQKLNLT